VTWLHCHKHQCLVCWFGFVWGFFGLFFFLSCFKAVGRGAGWGSYNSATHVQVSSDWCIRGTSVLNQPESPSGVLAVIRKREG